MLEAGLLGEYGCYYSKLVQSCRAIRRATFLYPLPITVIVAFGEGLLDPA